MPRLSRPATALAAALSLLATGAAAQDRPKVVTTFTVLADMARNVAGDAAEVVSVTKPGAEIHGYQPTPQDIVRALDADLVLWNGLNLELWFEQFLSNLRDVPSATLTEGIDPIPIAEGAYEGQSNPHAWMGVENAMVYVDNIADALSRIDPGQRRDLRGQCRGLQGRDPRRPSSPCATASPRSPRTSAGSSPARAPSATWRGISA